MRVSRVAVVVLITLSVAKSSEAQGQREWVPQGIEALRQGASSKTEFTLDHTMLVIASKLDPDDEDFRRVIAGVDGLSFHTFHYPQPWMYDPDVLRSVKQEYRAAGWHELVDSHGKNGPGLTELWVRSEHALITNVAILVVRSREITFVVVSGSISPLELLHIGGHFGIPKIEAGVKVPKNKRLPQAQPPAPPPVAAPGPAPEAADSVVEITSTPDGAEIEVDTVFVGSTPSTITLPAGDHVIAVKKAGYAVWERTLRITGGGTVRVDAPLEQQAPASEPR